MQLFHALCKIHDRAFNCLAPIGLGENNLSKYTNSLGRQDWTIQRLIQRMSIKKKQLDRGVDEQWLWMVLVAIKIQVELLDNMEQLQIWNNEMHEKFGDRFPGELLSLSNINPLALMIIPDLFPILQTSLHVFQILLLSIPIVLGPQSSGRPSRTKSLC